MNEALQPGATIGILGGGQLGRMLSVAAARLGYRCHVYEPGVAPAADVVHAVTHAPYEDQSALAAFAASVAVVTYEFENVPVAAVDALAETVPVLPGRAALATSQDRFDEKSFFARHALGTAPFALVTGPADLPAALARTGLPAILKTCRFGYDGKGQARVADLDEAGAAFDALGGVPVIAEGVVAFSAEISVIAARGRDGAVAAYDPGLNAHEGGILRRTTVPAPIPGRLKTDAVLMASRILTELDYVGVLGVELFVTPEGLLVNEIAPRVHNSGHWTQNGCAVDQFEQHIRAVAGWPLGDGARHSDVVMENLIGDDVTRVPALAAEADTAIHLYGKADARPGRKMGHVNRIRPLGA
jgi:5-(carboxyamino)imidazole ribonucleotide synthase